MGGSVTLTLHTHMYMVLVDEDKKKIFEVDIDEIDKVFRKQAACH